MNDSQTPLNAGSNASDFQPTTQNPQSLNGGNLQTPSSNVQPSGTSGSDQLYQRADHQAGLTVQTDNYSPNSLVSVQPAAIHSNSGLITVSGSLVILLLIAMIIGRYWRRLPDIESEIVNVPAIETVGQPATIVTDKPVATKATSKKKRPVSKQKRRSKKR